jgi:hypothetical protein
MSEPYAEEGFKHEAGRPLESGGEPKPETKRDSRRFAPDYIKPYEWAARAVGTDDFPRIVQVVTSALNGDKEKPNYSLGGVEKALRRFHFDLREKETADEADARFKAEEAAAADRAKAQREKDAADMEALKQKYSAPLDAAK